MGMASFRINGARVKLSWTWAIMFQLQT